nr:hypothetical protein [Abalone asfa-like virus]
MDLRLLKLQDTDFYAFRNIGNSPIAIKFPSKLVQYMLFGCLLETGAILIPNCGVSPALDIHPNLTFDEEFKMTILPYDDDKISFKIPAKKEINDEIVHYFDKKEDFYLSEGKEVRDGVIEGFCQKLNKWIPIQQELGTYVDLCYIDPETQIEKVLAISLPPCSY